MIWLVGAGEMSVNYFKVLEAKKQNCIVIGRGDVSAARFEKDTNHSVVIGGLKDFLMTKPDKPASAIVSVPVDELYDITTQLLDYGVHQILVEKPGGMSAKEIGSLNKRCDTLNANVYIAYNRRFFSSVRKAQEMIILDGGVTSFNFELTEWAHVIEKLEKPPEVLEKWFLANSSHVADLAFFLGGKPEQISSYTGGGLNWHPAASVFSGAGVSDKGALFNYSANWETAGRWSVEMLTKEKKYILSPMERLQVQCRGSLKIEEVELNENVDMDFKPGLYMQVEAFLNNDTSSLCSIDDQTILFSIYKKMAGYQ
jgi:predicted dehydrogenase